MITIGKPYIEQIDNKIYLKSHIVDEGQHIEEDLYYMSDLEYGKYFSSEVADSFLIGLLQPAIKHGQSIKIDSLISERLAYNLPTILYILSLGCCWNEDVSKINIDYSGVYCDYNHPTAVGCGCSLGVDSFAAMKYHFDNSCTKNHRITHLTYFNVGAMGYVDLEKARVSYEKDLKMVLDFANEVHLPVVTLESNISKWHSDFDFNDSGHFRNMSAILSLQKLFKYYLYASSFSVSTLHFDHKYMGYYESLLFPLLSTINTEIIISNPGMSRIDKTKYIVDDKFTQKYLYVCWKEITANKFPNGRIAAIKDNYLNCTRCDKCLRTLLAIDLLGKLDDYYSIFDIDYYKKEKDSYIAKVLLNKEKSTFYVELQDLMKEVGYQPSKTVKKELYKLEHPKIVRVYSKLCRLFRR